MDARRTHIQRTVKGHDPQLVCQRDHKGRLIVVRKNWAWKSFEHDGKVFLHPIFQPDFVLALTDTWQQNGVPREWGADQVLERLRYLDRANRNFYAEFVEKREKQAQSKARDKRNMFEAITYDARSEFKKAFSDINTSILPKKRGRIWTDERKVKNGNYQ